MVHTPLEYGEKQPNLERSQSHPMQRVLALSILDGLYSSTPTKVLSLT